MNTKSAKAPWIAPVASVIVALALGAWFYIIPDSYIDHHQWPFIVAIVAFVFFLYGICTLFWSGVPAVKLPQALLYLGLALMFISWFPFRTIAGIIVGAVMVLISVALLIFQHSRS